MNNEFRNIIKAVKSVKLSENEKAIMKLNIISSVIPSEFSNVTNSIPGRLYYVSDIGSYLNLFVKQNNYMAALIIAIMLAVSGGTSAVAENAIPGDALYAVKTSINEPVAGLFAVGGEAKATWQERLVERRLEEVQKVVAQGSVSTSTQAEIQSNVNNQVDKFTLAVKDLSQDKDNAVVSSELSVRLESALHAHQDILERATKEGGVSTSTKEMAKELLATFKERESDVKDHREEIELSLGDDSNASSTPEIAGLNKQAVAEKILNDVKSKYQEEKNVLSTSTRNGIDVKITEVEKTFTEGKANITSGNYDAARDNFQEVIKSANQTRSDVLTGSIKSHIEDDMDMAHENDNDEDDVIRNSNSANPSSIIRKSDDEGTSDIGKDSKIEGHENSRKTEIERED